jgi:hypothetical protein
VAVYERSRSKFLIAVALPAFDRRGLGKAPWQVTSAVNRPFNVKYCFIVTIENQVLVEGALNRMQTKIPQDRGRESGRTPQPGHVCQTD